MGHYGFRYQPVRGGGQDDLAPPFPLVAQEGQDLFSPGQGCRIGDVAAGYELLERGAPPQENERKGEQGPRSPAGQVPDRDYEGVALDQRAIKVDAQRRFRGGG